MKPASFDYVRAETLEEVLSTLAEEGGDARVIAGGQSLMPMLNMRLARPRVLVDIMRLPELDTITERKDAIVIGAGVRQAKLLASPILPRQLPLIEKALPFTGHAQTRSRGTVCGSIAHSDPSAELTLALVALRGSVHLRNLRRSRTVGADAFFTGMMATARAEDELIISISLPVAEPAGYAFREISRRHGDFAIVACAAIASRTGLRLAIGGVGDTPAARDFPRLAGAALDDALNEFAYGLDARDDVHATARYRRELVRRVGRAVIEEALACLV